MRIKESVEQVVFVLADHRGRQRGHASQEVTKFIRMGLRVIMRTDDRRGRGGGDSESVDV
jgi:hypothetical protein